MQVRWTDLPSKTLPASCATYNAIIVVQRGMWPEQFYDGCETLIDLSQRGRVGKHPGTRELVFTPLPYIAVYRIVGSVIEILHIWHGAQNR